MPIFVKPKLIFAVWMTIASTCVATDVSIRQNLGFQHLVAELQSLVQTKAKIKYHHFFVAKYPASKESTYLFWREGRRLWILGLGNKNPEHWHYVIHLPRSGTLIDLDKDVVPTTEAVGTSTYLVSQPWVNAIVYDTVLNGDLILIIRED